MTKTYVLVLVTYDWHRFQKNIFATSTMEKALEVAKRVAGKFAAPRIDEHDDHDSFTVETTMRGSLNNCENHIWIQELEHDCEDAFSLAESCYNMAHCGEVAATRQVECEDGRLKFVFKRPVPLPAAIGKIEVQSFKLGLRGHLILMPGSLPREGEELGRHMGVRDLRDGAYTVVSRRGDAERFVWNGDKVELCRLFERVWSKD